MIQTKVENTSKHSRLHLQQCRRCNHFNQSYRHGSKLSDRVIEEFSVDAKSPTVTIFSPTSENDGAMYLYGNAIKVVAGATDDVGIVDMQMRFVQNYGTSSSVTEPWRNVTGLTINEEDGDWTFEMSFSSGNFLPGVHEVSVKAVDSAGNERTTKKSVRLNFCRQRVPMVQRFVSIQTLLQKTGNGLS